MGGLAGLIGELLQERLGAIDPRNLAGRLRPKLPQLDSQAIAPRDGILGDKIATAEGAEQAVRRGLLEPESTAQLADAELRSQPEERLEDVDHAIDDLGTVERTGGRPHTVSWG